MKNNPKELQTVLDFVAGKMSAEDFKTQLYSNKAFEQFLDDSSEIPPNSYLGKNTYLFLLALDFDSPRDLLNAQGALTQFLDRRGIPYEKNNQYERFYDLLHDVQPSWLDIDALFFKNHILAGAPELEKSELKKWLRNKIKELFRCVNKAPKWIQNPNWPIRDNRPMVFLGQLPVKNYFHDDAEVYIFHDPATDSYETLIQKY